MALIGVMAASMATEAGCNQWQYHRRKRNVRRIGGKSVIMKYSLSANKLSGGVMAKMKCIKMKASRISWQ
jgi:hypothetical protein